MHSITALSRLTGLNPATVRTWERRYGVPQPTRAANGRRSYSEGEVDRLIAIARLVQAGHAISTLVEMPVDELAQLSERDEKHAIGSGASGLCRRAIDAAERADVAAFRLAVGEAMAALPPAIAAEHVIAPALREVGAMWASGAISVATEHALSAVTKQLLYASTNAVGWRTHGRTIAFATPEGETHELGTLLAFYIANAAGHGCSYFGPDLPADELVRAVELCDASVLVLGCVYVPEPDRVAASIAHAVTNLPDKTRVWVGGALDNVVLEPAIEERVVRLTSLERFCRVLSAQVF